MTLGVVHFAVLAFTLRQNSHLTLSYLATVFLETLTRSKVSGGISRYLCWSPMLLVADGHWWSVVNLRTIPVLRCKVQVPALGYSPGRGDKTASLHLVLRDQQISVNSPTCGTGISGAALVFRVRSPFAQLEGSPGLFTLGPSSLSYSQAFLRLEFGSGMDKHSIVWPLSHPLNTDWSKMASPR